MQCKSNAMKDYFLWLRRNLHSGNALQSYYNLVQSCKYFGIFLIREPFF